MKKILVKISFLLFIVVPSSNALAAPNISNITGQLLNSSNITITGSGFGSSGANVITWDNFESQIAGNPIVGAAPIIGPNYFTSSAGIAGSSKGITFSSEKGHSGSVAAKIDWTVAGKRNASFGWSGQGPYSSLYITYWRYMNYPNATLPSTTNHKQFYVFGSESINTPQSISCVPQGGQNWAFNNNNSSIPLAGNFSYFNAVNYSSTKDWAHTTNIWNRWEYWLKLNTMLTCTMGIDCDGQRDEWIDAKKYFTDSKYQWTNNTGKYNQFSLGTMHGMSDGTPDVGQAYFDDLYISTSQARVEIGDANTWDSCNHREIQISQNNWNDGQIEIKINQGSFANGSPVYLYVVDENGNVNTNGYPVSFGSNSSIDTIAPATPSGFIVQ